MNTHERIYGIIGESIDYSLSPKIYNRLFAEQRISAKYKLYNLKPDQLESFVASARFTGLAGFNVTTPHKEAIVRFADKTDKISAATQSVNLVINQSRTLLAYNTDFEGIRESIEGVLKLDVRGKEVSIIGSGGAAHTVFYYLICRKARRVTVFHRSALKLLQFGSFARKLQDKSEYRPVMYEDRIGTLSECDLCINCTPIPYVELVEQKDQERPKRVFELRYGDYPLLGKNHIRGNQMLAVQAAVNFEIMTGVQVKVKRIMRIINEELNCD